MMDDLIVTKGVCLANTSYLRDFFKTNKVEVHLETAITQITPGKNIMIKHKDGSRETIPCDSVIFSIGYNPAPLEGSGVYRIGDAKQVGNLRTVIWGAWDVAMKI